MILMIDTHNSKNFGIAMKYENNILFDYGSDASSQLASKIHNMIISTNTKIDTIVIIKGPGSLTGLRIGASFANGYKSGNKQTKILSIALWDILTNEYDADIFFYTGTKKWILKNKNTEKILNCNELTCNNKWISNAPEKTNLDMKNNIQYPNIIELMPKYLNKATNDLNLIYAIDVFKQC